jgi:leucyl-tRNA synthetase
MEFLNALGKYQGTTGMKPALLRAACEKMLLLYAPFAPHFCEEIWEKFGNAYSIFNQAWPQFDPSALVLDTIEIAVQINGSVKFRLDIDANLSAEDVEALVRGDQRLPEALDGRSIVKFIYVKGRLANIVAK